MSEKPVTFDDQERQRVAARYILAVLFDIDPDPPEIVAQIVASLRDPSLPPDETAKRTKALVAALRDPSLPDIPVDERVKQIEMCFAALDLINPQQIKGKPAFFETLTRINSGTQMLRTERLKE